MFYAISQPFFEDIDLTFCTHIHETLPSNICYGLLKNFDLGGNCFEKKKIDLFYFFLKIFKLLKIRDSSFVAQLILRQFT